jgi:hypothetical protein
MRVAILPEYPGYVISDDGRIQGPRGWWLTTYPDPAGHHKISVYVDGKRKNARVHVLVCSAFHGPRPEGKEVVESDNRASNLAWGTHVENCADRDRHGATCRGERHHRAKLTRIQVRQIRARYAAGGPSQRCLGKEYGVSQQAIKKIVNYESWKGV